MKSKKSLRNLKLSVIPASKMDLSQIFNLEDRIYKPYCPFSRSQLRYLLSSPNASFFLCYNDGDAIGYGIAIKNKLRNGQLKGRIYNIGVMPEFQLRGAGTLLLRAMEKSLIKSGVSYIVLETMKGNEGAASFFVKYGYAESEFLPGYYSPGDAVRMKKETMSF